GTRPTTTAEEQPMAVRAVVITLAANQLTLIADGSLADAQAPASFLVKPDSANTDAFYVGGDDMTSANEATNGYAVVASDPAIAVDLHSGDKLYAIGAGGEKIHVLKTRS
ncbi:MAG TPA: hypothetical protein VFH70_13745, partial [Acidimicrobiales bacterium]|nr:hypothetical protein [Acidimicrobiales bacterium]